MKNVLLYTMTSGLGDLVVLSDLMQKIEQIIPETSVITAHRGNKHVSLWQKGDYTQKFFDVYHVDGWIKLCSSLKSFKKEGARVYAIQMAPGSLQGFYFYSFLKKLGCIDYIVDFNLFNADIVIPKRGEYLLDIHLNQIADLFRMSIPTEYFKLSLTLFKPDPCLQSASNQRKRVGIHPWSRRGYSTSFAWPLNQWKKIISFLLQRTNVEVVLIGKDAKFNDFKNDLINSSIANDRLLFQEAHSVEAYIKSINSLDLLITVNSSSVHIGHALEKEMFILNGPSLDFWIPKSDRITNFYDTKAFFPGMDKITSDPLFPSLSRIPVESVIAALERKLL